MVSINECKISKIWNLNFLNFALMSKCSFWPLYNHRFWRQGFLEVHCSRKYYRRHVFAILLEYWWSILGHHRISSLFWSTFGANWSRVVVRRLPWEIGRTTHEAATWYFWQVFRNVGWNSQRKFTVQQCFRMVRAGTFRDGKFDQWKAERLSTKFRQNWWALFWDQKISL